MAVYEAPLRDLKFLTEELLETQNRANEIAPFAEATPDLMAAIFEEGGKIACDVLLPLNASGDEAGCKIDGDEVTTPEGFKEAYNLYVEGGWPSLNCDPNYGGQGMPFTVGAAMNEIFSSANMAFAMYPGLTHGAYSAIHAHGSEELKSTYLPNLASGAWTGTMNLTEPHCGTDLGLIRTKAEPDGAGAYKISGQKIFISAGEHDLAENIIHLVLAKLPDAPDGVKGISLFVAPKFMVNEDGSLGARNALGVGKIEEKMGIHANATCVMNYDGATGYLVGEPHNGLRAMFTMMNEARLGVAIQGLAQSEIAYQNAVAYAKDRRQGRALAGPAEPDKPADPLMVHPDVRRMLMNQKAFNEGLRALALYTALQLDIAHAHADEAARQAADDFVQLITPVLKGFGTDKGFDYCVTAQQIYGGHGYIEEWGMSQYVRDARIAMIYEGANGVQALDLIGRKLPAKNGRAIMGFFKTLDDWGKARKDDPAMADFVKPLREARDRLQAAAMYFMQAGMKNPDNAAAGSWDFMHLFGHVALGFMWARMAEIATARLAEGAGDDAGFYETKLATARYYMARMLPDTAAHLAKIETGAGPVMALDAEAF